LRLFDASRSRGVEHVDDALVTRLRIGADNYRIFATELLEGILEPIEI
jgi:hypothetical protein